MNSPIRQWLVAAASCSLLSVPGLGCGDAVPSNLGDGAEEAPTRTSQHHIEGGTTDTSSTAVVGIVIRRGRGAAICTGTLVTPNLVLTARHCVSNLSSDRIRCGNTRFTGTLDPGGIGVTTDGTDIRDDPDDGFSVTDIFVPPNDDSACGSDIALLQLGREVPSGRATPRAPRVSASTRGGETYTAIGYGVDDSGRGSGTRRRLGGINVLCVGSNCQSQRFVESNEFAGGGGVCEGDSGGGAYVASGKVIGIAARADPDCTRSIYTRVFPWRQWLSRAATNAVADGSYPAPDWMNVADDDGDGVINKDDNCPNTSNPDQKDLDGDGIGDACDSDLDGDGVPNGEDNCPRAPNPDQRDLDDDGQADACDPDRDSDDVPDEADICPNLKNPAQRTSGPGDSCKDSDGDLWADVADNCPETPNPDQVDSDGDGEGDACDDSPSMEEDPGGSEEESNSEDPPPKPVPKPQPRDETASSGCSTAESGASSDLPVSGLFALVWAGLLGGRRTSSRRSDQSADPSPSC